MRQPHLPAQSAALWRRAIQALAHAFDLARGSDDETVFQPRPRKAPDKQASTKPLARPPEETLQ
jgi:hypothetical protein